MRWAANQPDWVLGFQDEVWWSRLAHPVLHTWAEAQHPLRLVEQTVAKDDPDPKAVACYGLLVHGLDASAPAHEEVWLRFVAERPVSAVTTLFLEWCCQKLAAAGKTALLLVWDNASWHCSAQVRTWLRTHNHAVRATGQGVRIIPSFLPVKSPWLNPIEPRWLHAKRRIVEPDRLLTADEIRHRVAAAFDCPLEAPLSSPKQVA
jgi:transposase